MKATLQGLRRSRGTAQQRAKPLLRDDLTLVLDRLGTTTRDTRDRALLLIGFSGGFRRSELVALDHADIEQVRQGLIFPLRRSKTDQEGAGRKIGIPFGRTRHCLVAALDGGLSAKGITSGPLFLPVDRHGHVHPDRLPGDAVSEVIRERVASAGIVRTRPAPDREPAVPLRPGNALPAEVPTRRSQPRYAAHGSLVEVVDVSPWLSELAENLIEEPVAVEDL